MLLHCFDRSVVNGIWVAPVDDLTRREVRVAAALGFAAPTSASRAAGMAEFLAFALWTTVFTELIHDAYAFDDNAV